MVNNKEINKKKKVEDLLGFIQRAKEIHGDKYDYSKSVYQKSIIPVEIVCPIHGSFYMRPHNHLKGQGCPLCANKEKGAYKKIIQKILLKEPPKSTMANTIIQK